MNRFVVSASIQSKISTKHSQHVIASPYRLTLSQNKKTPTKQSRLNVRDEMLMEIFNNSQFDEPLIMTDHTNANALIIKNNSKKSTTSSIYCSTSDENVPPQMFIAHTEGYYY